MNRVKLLISYDGTNYSGWQRQAHETKTIQGTMEKVLSELFDHKITLIGSGRTDAGVHAEGQVAHFNTDKNPEKYELCYAMNRMLPTDITAKGAWLVPHDFHAQFSVDRKTYKYRIFNSTFPTAFHNRFSCWIQRPLDVDYLTEISHKILGKQDFKSFQTKGSVVSSTVREISKACWTRKGSLVIFEVTGTGFLKNMVRNIVGTTLWMHFQGMDPGSIRHILEARDRRAARAPAPAHGLSLYNVKYPEFLDKASREI